MKRAILILVAMASCGEGSNDLRDPHEQTTCDATWGAGFEGLACELACVSEPPDSADECPVTVNGQPGICNDVFESFGVRGCCVRGGGVVDGFAFAECE